MDGAVRDQVPQAATAGEYVAQLRVVRRCSGLTYREVTRRASAAGHWLPPSTLATMLGRTTLPRERTVVALLAACGTPPEEIGQWVGMRRDIEARATEQERRHGPAAPTDEVTDDGPHPADDPHTPDDSHPADGPVTRERPPPRVRRATRAVRRRLRLGALALLVGLSVGASGALLAGDSGTQSTPDGPSADGCPLVLRQGMYGPCVLSLQERLAAGGLYVPVDGWFGPDTASRVMAFQALGGLPASGAVDADVLHGLSGEPVVTTWPEDRIRKQLRLAFPEDPAGATRLAGCLSGLDPYRVEIRADGSRRWGLFQFSDMELARLDVDHRTALDPGWSIRAARGAWSATRDFDNWHCVSSP
ncbi:peptidoglycan-binding protein [Micromonospora sp. 067-2]|uniref:peptidoglycan-binding protein n=1 Tax=Micromonospora sp. 067-2 TaxID=2789270 RepID=UPI00397A8D07